LALANNLRNLRERAAVPLPMDPYQRSTWLEAIRALLLDTHVLLQHDQGIVEQWEQLPLWADVLAPIAACVWRAEEEALTDDQLWRVRLVVGHYSSVG
jgi:hypothetical protein